jgi:LPXTG-motif cell wall-anchored protein
MKLLNFTKTWILMALVLNCAHADIDRTYFKSDEEINKEYQNDPQGLERYGADTQRQYLKKYEQSILDAKDLTQDQAIELLATKLMAASMRSTFQVTGRIAVYDKLQAALLAIPGYGDYYTDQIEQSRAKAKAPGAENGETISYDDKRGSIIEVMANLPGPETIKFLGRYLYDDRDPRPPFGDYPDCPRAASNSDLAASVIHGIGLRNSPTEQVNVTHWEDLENIALRIAVSKAWWEKVKAGQIPFSFIRQTVEYRFRPDGTWETTQLPISALERDKTPSAPAQPPSTVRPDKRSPAPLASTNANATSLTSKPWPAILGAVLASIIAAWYFLRRRKVS